MEEAAERIDVVNEWLEAIDLVLISRDRMGPLSEMATHDTALGAAARAFGLDVRGI